MIKKIIFSILGFLAGFEVGIWTNFWAPGFIQDLYIFFTDHHIRFHGKVFVPFYFGQYFPIIIGLCGVFCYHAFRICTLREKMKYASLAVGIFFLVLALLCYFDSNMKIVECTACDDGIRTLEYSDIQYERIIFASLALSLLPIGIKYVRSQKRSD